MNRLPRGVEVARPEPGLTLAEPAENLTQGISIRRPKGQGWRGFSADVKLHIRPCTACWFLSLERDQKAP